MADRVEGMEPGAGAAGALTYNKKTKAKTIVKLLNGKEERRKFEEERRRKLEAEWGESWEERDARIMAEKRAAEADAVAAASGGDGDEVLKTPADKELETAAVEAAANELDTTAITDSNTKDKEEYVAERYVATTDEENQDVEASVE